MDAKPRQTKPAGQRADAAPVGHNLRIVNALRRIIRAADMASHALAATHHITAPQLFCLLAITTTESATAVEVARRVHLNPSTLVGILDRLAAKGLIERARSVEDRRTITLVATPAGRALAKSTPFPLQLILDGALAELSPAERENVAGGLERLVTLMHLGEVDASPLLEVSSVRQAQDRD